MVKLTDTATTILAAAAKRDNRRILPLPTLKAPPVIVRKTLTMLLAAGLAEEIPANRNDEAWAPSDGKGPTTLIVTAAGLAAIGIMEETVSEAPPKRGAKQVKGRAGGRTGSKGSKAAKGSGRPRPGDGAGKKHTKQDIILTLLRRSQGATIEEMTEATDWQAHSIRGWMSGAAKKRLGLSLVSAKDRSGERRYYIAPER